MFWGWSIHTIGLLQILGHYFLCIWRSSCLSTMCHRELSSKLLVVVPFDKLKLESQVSLFKTTMIHNDFQKLKKSGKKCNNLKRMWLIISSFKVLTWAYLGMWSLPNLICVRFQDLLKMNIVSTLHLSWKAHFIIVSPPILTCVWECFHKTFITLSLFLILPSWKEKKTCYKINVWSLHFLHFCESFVS